MSLEESKQLDNTNEQLIQRNEYGQNENNLDMSNGRDSVTSKNGLTLREKEGISITQEGLPDINVTGSIQARNVTSPSVDAVGIKSNSSIARIESKQNKRILSIAEDRPYVSFGFFSLKIMNLDK